MDQPSRTAFRKRPTLGPIFLALLAGAIICYFTPGTFGLDLLLMLATLGVGVVLAFRGARVAMQKSIWRLRNRLIVTYVFIGVVPLVLLLVLVVLAGYILAGQTGIYLLSSELDRTLTNLELPARILALNPDARHDQMLDQVATFMRQRFPDFEVAVRRGDQVLHYPLTSTLRPAAPEAPAYNGLAVRNGQCVAWSHRRVGETTVDVVAPLYREMLAQLAPNLGRVELERRGRRVDRRDTAAVSGVDDIDVTPPAVNQFDAEVTWYSRLGFVAWPTGKPVDGGWLMIVTRPSALLGAIFNDRFQIAQSLLLALLAMAILFLIVEGFSLFIGVRLTRSITSSVQELYDGTQHVSEGDFAHRIQVKGKDQLAEVNRSFNSMTVRLQELLEVAKEKERLQSEIEIAREVQGQLFPRSLPKLPTLDVVGLCRPARMVSGDYYDFLCLQENNLALAIGDVAGKGISAALLMASIQSIMRMQLSGTAPVMAAVAGGQPKAVYSTSLMVSALNRQLYANTAPEKYATFFFGIYHEPERTFTYTNAGHLPPILIRRGQAELLEVTGTVIGAFPAAHYEEIAVRLEPGDLLLSYTDGVTEPENAYGEEFGVERLVETVLKYQKLEPGELIAKVMDEVRDWTNAPELPDDMTVVLARRTG